ncbi:MAG: DUF2877 domain-containing protein, partial [Eubacteriales bacterium]|nr:DUF2877 domain-containing protein [Eubacteriales bacterium]
PISREAKWISPEFEQFKNSYLKALNSPANSAAEAWTEASTAALALLGFGTGMTPFMDDFICGLLFARLVLRQAQAAGISYKDRSSRELKTAELKVKAESQEELEQKLAAEEIFISQIRQTARQKTNRISADLIKQAADGLASEILKKMLTALFDRCDGEVKTSLEELVKIGQSSGSDLAAGIYFALKTATLTGA